MKKKNMIYKMSNNNGRNAEYINNKKRKKKAWIKTIKRKLV